MAHLSWFHAEFASEAYQEFLETFEVESLLLALLWLGMLHILVNSFVVGRQGCQLCAVSGSSSGVCAA